jgi:hypothetical protein
MKFVYILVVLVIAALASGCVDKKQTETSTDNPVQSPGESAAPMTETSSAVSQAPDDLFDTESDLNAMNSTLSDMDMQISLVDTI